MDDYLAQLNRQQREAVLWLDSPQLVIAGAGSGKTRVLTYKIIHLLAKGYKPWRIMALTFTNKAAREMRERIDALVGDEVSKRLWMGTFHSIFLRILRSHSEKIGYRKDFTIYDADDSKALVKTIIKEMNLDDKIYKVSSVLGAISGAKNALISPVAYAADKDIRDQDFRSRRPLIHRIYDTYQRRCYMANVMDFDDILFFTNMLLRDCPEILNHYREYFQYILVDEYQDTNFAQHAIIRRLTENQTNLSVVGDDAQSIYSFRGANIGNILNMQNVYPDLRIFKLEQNYRSTKTIIEAANSLISKNTRQIPKQIFSKNEDGKPIEIIKSYSDFEEGYLIANRISQMKLSSHDSYSDYAILYRTNAQSRTLEESLRKRNIPYRIYGALSFYQRKEIKDAIAYFRLVVNPSDEEAFRRIINYPARGIGETTVSKISDAATIGSTSLWNVINDPSTYSLNVNSGTRRKLEGFANLIREFIEANSGGMNAYELGELIIRKTQILSILLSDRTPESISRQENLQELLNGLRTFVQNRLEEGETESISMSDFLSEVSLATDFDRNENNDGEAVSLMTVHSAKGLEFKNVCIVGVEEDLFPAMLSTMSFDDIEEERRLLYVAITRAKKQCILSYAASRYRNGQTTTCFPSRFLRDIDSRYLREAGTTSSLTSNFDTWDRTPQVFRPASFQGGKLASRQVGKSASRNENSKTRQPENSTTLKPDDGYSLHDAGELKVGMNIEHNRFGRGHIVSIDRSSTDDRIVVSFSNVETKTLLLKFARFKIVD